MADTVELLKDFVKRLEVDIKRYEFDMEQLLANRKEINNGLLDAQLSHYRELQEACRNSIGKTRQEINEFV